VWIVSTAFDFQPTLKGALIEMRPATEADFEPLYAIASDPLIWAVHPVPERAQRPAFRDYFDEALGDQGGLVAVDQATGKIAGFSRYSQRFVGPDEIEIGWTFLGRAYWGGRFNGEMKQLMLAHALETFPRVIFRIGADNVRSRRAIEKIGGTQIDWHEEGVVFDRKVIHVAYEITRAVFAAQLAWRR
jgi:RimJ/RimL family protein N-acetyltransferase